MTSPSAASTSPPTAPDVPRKSGRARAHRFQVAPEHRRDQMQLVDIGHRLVITVRPSRITVTRSQIW